MKEEIRVLWEYASRCRLDGFYDRDAQQSRDECANAISCNRAELKKACPPDLFRRVAALCDCGEELRQRDMEAAFACGFCLGSSLR